MKHSTIHSLQLPLWQSREWAWVVVAQQWPLALQQKVLELHTIQRLPRLED
jgi:hypothetical protein